MQMQIQMQMQMQMQISNQMEICTKKVLALPFGILKQMQVTVPSAARMFSIHILQIDVHLMYNYVQFFYNTQLQIQMQICNETYTNINAMKSKD